MSASRLNSPYQASSARHITVAWEGNAGGRRHVPIPRFIDVPADRAGQQPGNGRAPVPRPSLFLRFQLQVKTVEAGGAGQEEQTVPGMTDVITGLAVGTRRSRTRSTSE